jgi:hypothetical protein
MFMSTHEYPTANWDVSVGVNRLLLAFSYTYHNRDRRQNPERHTGVRGRHAAEDERQHSNRLSRLATYLSDL